MATKKRKPEEFDRKLRRLWCLSGKACTGALQNQETALCVGLPPSSP